MAGAPGNLAVFSIYLRQEKDILRAIVCPRSFVLSPLGGCGGFEVMHIILALGKVWNHLFSLCYKPHRSYIHKEC